MHSSRRLAAVWFADVVGYTQLAANDERAALEAIRIFQHVVLEEVGQSGGRVVKFYGDGALADFQSVEAAVRSALRVTRAIDAKAEDAARAVSIRIGVHVGDVVTPEDGDLYGDGINIAARLHAVADPGQVIVTEDVWRQLRQLKEYTFQQVGERELKGLSDKVLVFRVTAPEQTLSARPETWQGQPPARRLKPNRKGLAAVSLVLVTASVTAFVVWSLISKRSPPNAAVVALFPFTDAAGQYDPRVISNLRENLASGIEMIPDSRVVDAVALISDANSAVMSTGPILKEAANRDARYAVVAELVGVPNPRVMVDLFDVDRRERVLRTFGGGEEETLVGGVQRLSLEVAGAIVRQLGMENDPVARLLTTTRSPVALAEFLNARALLWSGDTDGAIGGFERALAADDDFGPAYFYLSTAQAWPPRWNYDAGLTVVEVGLSRGARLPVRWRQLLEAQREYLLRNGQDAIAGFYSLVSEHPQFPEAWFGLGESYFHLSGFGGAGPQSSMPVFLRLVAIDSTFAGSFTYSHIVDAALWRRDFDHAWTFLDLLESPIDRAARDAALKLLVGSEPERIATRRAMESFGVEVIAQMAYLSADDPTLLADIGKSLLGERRSPSDRRVGARFRFAGLAGAGRWLEAVEVWESELRTEAFDPWMLHAYFAGFPAEAYALPMLRFARRMLSDTSSVYFGGIDSDRNEWLRALVQANLINGDSVEAALLQGHLDRAASGPTDPELDGLKHSIAARMSLLGADTASAIDHLEQALSRGPWAVDSYYRPLADAAPQRLLLAKLYAARGQPERARIWANSFGRNLAVGDGLYLPAARRLLRSVEESSRSTPYSGEP
jgi:adenylate cyclase